MNWLENLKPGNNVILNSGFNDKCVVSVKRTTKTQIIIERDNLKFSKTNGLMVGTHGYFGPYITEATPEIIAEMRTNNERKRIINKISTFDYKKVGIEYLFMIEDILKQVDNG